MATPTSSPARTPTDAHPPTMRPAHAPFSETHRRTVDAPIDIVWPAAVAVTAREIRAFGPLIALRGLPTRMLRNRAGVADRPGESDASLLDLFESEGFVRLLEQHEGDTRRVEYGAAGRFWSPTENRPVRFEGSDGYATFDEPGHAVIWFDLTARAHGDRTELTTTTLVWGTDRGAERRFAPYWALIRLPSGLIRRSWLAAIDRRATR